MPNFSESSNSHYRAKQRVLKCFIWKGIISSGELKSAYQLAYTEAEVREELANQNIQIIRIRSKSPSTYTQIQNRITEKDIHYITKQLGSMITASLPLSKALRLIARNTNKASIRSLLVLVTKDIEEGKTLSQSLRQANHHFSGAYSDLIEAGEKTGKLPEAFEQIIGYQSKSLSLKTNLKKAMLYPIIVLSVTTTVLTLMLLVVIPEFEAMFRNLDGQLPWLTKMLISISEWFQARFQLLLVSMFSLVLVLWQFYTKSERFRYWFSKTILRLPVIGDLTIKSSIARFCRTLSTCYSAGIPILNALDLSSKATSSPYYQKALKSIIASAASGTSLHLAIQQTNKFPPVVSQMIMAGEESGMLEHMLTKLADMYESEVDDSIESLGKTIEPVLIVVLSAVIGTIVVSMYLPIFNLLSVLG
ncbi:type II secretion system F family protein [Vibrio sp. HN007]|uniref:type II secretion system F family protein n=1 Tax=Vibrio iocasae TaxID=3098914 RepID=UPI0035D3F7E0